MPNEIKQLENGTISAKLEDGTTFEGDPLSVTTKLAEAKMNTVRWGQEWKQKAEAVQAQPAQPTQSVTDASQQQLRDYLVTETAMGLGYKSGDEFKADLAKVKSTTEKVANNLVVTEFFNLCPDFPNTDAASAALSKKIDEMHWDFSPQAMTAAHALLVREHDQDPTKGYAPLTAEQINSTWANQMAAANRVQAPPMLHGNNPELAATGGQDPWNMPLNELRALAIRQQLESRK